jgi:hypothetical protein
MLPYCSGGSIHGGYRRPVARTAAADTGAAKCGPGVERSPSRGAGAVPVCVCSASCLACRFPGHQSAGTCFNCSARAATAAAAATCSCCTSQRRRHGCRFLCSITYTTSSCSCAAVAAGWQRCQLTAEGGKTGRVEACAQEHANIRRPVSFCHSAGGLCRFITAHSCFPNRLI